MNTPNIAEKKTTNNSLLSFSTDRQTIKKSAISSIIMQIIFKLKGIITMPIMTYYLTPDNMGTYNLIIVTATMLTSLFYLNLADGPVIFFVQEKSKERIRDMYNTVTNSSIIFFMLFSLIFSVLVFYLGKEYKYLFFVLPVIFSSIFYKLTSYLFAVFQKTTELVRNTLLKDAFATILTILLVIIGLSYYGIIYAIIIGNIVAGIRIYRLIQRELPFRIFIDRKVLVKLLKISLPLLPVSFFCWTIQSSDSYILAYYKNKETVGKYSIIYGLTNVILIVTFALHLFWYPVSARLWIERREKYQKMFCLMFTAFATMLMIAVIFFELNSRIIMNLFVRNIQYHDAYYIMGIIAFAFSMQVLITLLTAPLYSNRNTIAIFLSYLTGSLLNTVLNFLLIPSAGILGAATATGISYLVVVICMSYLNYKMAQFPFIDGRLPYIIGGFILAWIGIVFLREYLGQYLGQYQTIFVNIPVFITIGLFLYFFFFKKEEKEYLHKSYKEFNFKKVLSWER